ncbi:MAG TPA: carboxypeptidase regulatory-like domain-containing protein, partial [Pyrinomonadaceae bacterium]|nr:carboxypeptidase regulatory-like domain-containing protein [Pyrinomonadaceae bacterium]
TKMGGVESLWATHTVRRVLNGLAAPRYYQVPVTGGTVGPNITQAATFDPDGANVISRFMPSIALDRAGNMALGYSTSSSTTKPAIKYAGRLATDPINTFSQSEQVLIQGAGTQTGNCGGAPCTRWGDYSAMSVDPDGCTFWYTNMYYAADGLNHHTRIGSFSLPQCTVAGTGTLQGTVTSGSGGGPISGATISLGARSTTTDASGFYSFPNLPPGTYPNVTATFPGYTSSSVNSVVVPDGGTTVQDFVLSPGDNPACFTDTTQLDFQRGVFSAGIDLLTSPGDVRLSDAPTIDQQNLNVTNSGFGMNATNWAGQTFTAGVSGQLTRVDLDLFCSGCTGTTPNITVSIRATAGSPAVPTGADLATATIPGFNTGAGGFFTANFTTPLAITAGTRYAVILRPVANPSAGTYAYVVSSANPYLNGQRVTSANSGGTWVADVTSGGRDLGFKVFVKTGFPPSGNLTSGIFDGNPYTGGTTNWTTLSWTATVPADTNLRFQVAGSNSINGPFNFVGPDGTAGTFFTTTGASLSQFNGLRYLKYQAFLSTTNNAATPTLSDVTLCRTNTVPTSLTVSSATGIYAGTVNLSATLTDGTSPVSGKTINFTLNGNSVGSGVTDGSGVATLNNASLSGIDAGGYPNGVGASFAGDDIYLASSATNSLTVNKAPSTTTVTCPVSVLYSGLPLTPCTATATGAGGLNVPVGVTYLNNVDPGIATANATYAGDINHDGSSGTATFTITALQVNFAIGDLNAAVGQKVTFWGAQWAKQNSLSGGAAPSSFKGFANTTSPNPANCGGTWSTGPGGDTGAPASVPKFITIMVTSSATKSGSTISGNVTKLVIIQVDPGYSPDPATPGTGTVYSVVCP